MKRHYLYIALAILAAVLYGRMAWVMVEKTAADRIEKKVQANIEGSILAERKARIETPQIVVTQTVNLGDKPKAEQTVRATPVAQQPERAAYTAPPPYTPPAYTPPPITNVYITNPPMAEAPQPTPEPVAAPKTLLQEALEIVQQYDPTGTVQHLEEQQAIRIYAFNGKDATLDIHDGWQETLKGVLNKIK